MKGNVSKDNLRKIYGKVSPFEFKDKLSNLDIPKREEMTDEEFDTWLHDEYWKAAADDAELLTRALFPDGKIPPATQEDWDNFKATAKQHGINI